MILVLQQAGACAARNPLHGLLGANQGESPASNPVENRGGSLIGSQNGCLADRVGHCQTGHQNGGPGFCARGQNDPQSNHEKDHA